MIDGDIKIKFAKDGVSHTMSVSGLDNLPYNLAEMFSEVIKASDANPAIVVEQLANEFGCTHEERDTDMISPLNLWHTKDVAPTEDKLILYHAGWRIFGTALGLKDWEDIDTSFIDGWCYISDIIPQEMLKS